MSGVKINEVALVAACKQFVNEASDSDLYRLAWNGSIWVKLDDVQADAVDVDSFLALGNASDLITKEVGEGAGAVLLLDLDSMADCFVFDGDDIEELGASGDLRVAYSAEAARREILAYALPSSDFWADQVSAAVENASNE